MKFTALISVYDGEKDFEFYVNCPIEEAYSLAEKMVDSLAHPAAFVHVIPAEDIKHF